MLHCRASAAAGGHVVDRPVNLLLTITVVG
jgi:hypothetical protein